MNSLLSFVSKGVEIGCGIFVLPRTFYKSIIFGVERHLNYVRYSLISLLGKGIQIYK